MGTLFVDKLEPQSGTSLEIGSSGDTITIPSGATLTNNGTATGFGGITEEERHFLKYLKHRLFSPTCADTRHSTSSPENLPKK